jgi:hypothetical protein
VNGAHGRIRTLDSGWTGVRQNVSAPFRLEIGSKQNFGTNEALPPPDSNNDDSIKGVLHDGDGKNVGALQTGAVARVRK